MGWSQNNSTRRASERCWRIASFDADRIVQSMSKVEVKKKGGGGRGRREHVQRKEEETSREGIVEGKRDPSRKCVQKNLYIYVVDIDPIRKTRELIYYCDRINYIRGFSIFLL